MPGLSKVIVLDPDARARRQVQLGFEREGVHTAAAATEAELAVPGEDAGLVVVGGVDGHGVEQVRRARGWLAGRGIDVPLVFAGRGAEPRDATAAGADEVVRHPAYLRDVVTIGRLLVGRPADQRDRIVGNLIELTGVFTLVRALSALGRSATLTLIRGLRRGEVRFYFGEVTSAQVGLIHGQAALHQLLLWTDARFDFHHQDVVRRQQIPLSRDELFADAERFLDGVRDSSGGLSPAMVLEQDLPRVQALAKQIPTEVYGVLRMFDGHRALADVLEDSAYRVFETLRVAQRAVEAGLIRVVDKPPPRPGWRTVLAIEDWLVGSEPRDAVARDAVRDAVSDAVRVAVNDPRPATIRDARGAPVPPAKAPGEGAGQSGQSGKTARKRRKKKRRADTPPAVAIGTAAIPEIDWGALVPRIVGAEVGPLAGVVPASHVSGEIVMTARSGRGDEPTPEPTREPTIVFDEAAERAEAERAAAQRAAERAEAERAEAEARAQAERAEAEARAQAERAAVEARAQAERAAVEARAQAERAEAEARAHVEAEQAAALALARAEAERAQAERVAAEVHARAEAERAQAERAAAEHAAAEVRAAAEAERAAAERAEAERVAIERAAAEAEQAAAMALARAEAERIAAERAAARARARAEADRVQTERAEAERAAAEARARAEADRAAAEAHAHTEAERAAAEARARAEADRAAAEAHAHAEAERAAAEAHARAEGDRTEADRVAAEVARAEVARAEADRAEGEAHDRAETDRAAAEADARAAAERAEAQAHASAAAERAAAEAHARAEAERAEADRVAAEVARAEVARAEAEAHDRAEADRAAAEADARADADRAAAEADARAAADRAAAEAEARAKAERAAAEAHAQRAAAEAEAHTRADADRAKAEADRAKAERAAAEAERAAAERAAAEADARADADRAEADARADADRAAAEAERAAAERAAAEADARADADRAAAEAGADADRAAAEAKRAEAGRTDDDDDDDDDDARANAIRAVAATVSVSSEPAHVVDDLEVGDTRPERPGAVRKPAVDPAAAAGSEAVAVPGVPDAAVVEDSVGAVASDAITAPIAAVSPPDDIAEPVAGAPDANAAPAPVRAGDSTPSAVVDEPSDGVVRHHIATAETAPVKRRNLPHDPRDDDRPGETTGEITMPRARPQVVIRYSEPTILVPDLADIQAELGERDPAASPARPAAGGAHGDPVFSDTEEAFFDAGQDKNAGHHDAESFDDLDEGYRPLGFWERLTGRGKPGNPDRTSKPSKKPR